MDAETRAEILEATNRALCEHGYAGLTVQRIAEESSVTSAAIHYHFDTKEELLNAFLDDRIERFESKLSCGASDPRKRLDAVLDAVFNPEDPDVDGFPVALMELKAQAPYHELFRERFLDLDDVMRGTVADIVRDGVETGAFDEADPAEIARLVTTMSNGAHARAVALDEHPAETRRVVEDALELHLGWTPGAEVER
ncbi:TetR/AcrR family transcriptional regulator [Haloferax sp. Atlit-10N]|uniref:TetR family transcriptional regulator n=1 Tax=Haloferax prahovense (strain DSM 18310 / JCM 13924 / TL6) TaxID=1227461 RepID=M0GCB0_HALPT|nr:MULTISPECIES: TetR/AcrR family transcriptional regulator [Haloferax]ELZ69172.1 TetR family transcriptional regulator [Haloferax prahovense DSM 18310]RDZ42258.1 TetR/AcrR family transcriptional regulator [Haloferax sp. Atlit-19N]RDZ42543.1 TetR/AcrR family transcriptional regulator [Haloferax sp. Atlit-16N]RDZ57416.1 TetR/AcrR family transcriptional regulator [Haloferax sp. Atlit-10N]